MLYLQGVIRNQAMKDKFSYERVHYNREHGNRQALPEQQQVSGITAEPGAGMHVKDGTTVCLGCQTTAL